jgi:transcriptional regulator with XRE-family HTH domain
VDFKAYKKRVGANVRKARWIAGQTQEETATDVLTFRLLGVLERGGGNPTLQTLFLLAKRLGVSVRDLVEVGGEEPLDVPLHKAVVEKSTRSGPKPKPRRRPTRG